MCRFASIRRLLSRALTGLGVAVACLHFLSAPALPQAMGCCQIVSVFPPSATCNSPTTALQCASQGGTFLADFTCTLGTVCSPVLATPAAGTPTPTPPLSTGSDCCQVIQISVPPVISCSAPTTPAQCAGQGGQVISNAVCNGPVCVPVIPTFPAGTPTPTPTGPAGSGCCQIIQVGVPPVISCNAPATQAQCSGQGAQFVADAVCNGPICIPVIPTFGAGTPTPTSTPPTQSSCVGDCNDSHDVTVDELLTMVNIALGNADVSTCKAGDANNSMDITIDEILTAVNYALSGCPGTPV
jgi:hypothetical protein